MYTGVMKSKFLRAPRALFRPRGTRGRADFEGRHFDAALGLPEGPFEGRCVAGPAEAVHEGAGGDPAGGRNP